MASWRPFWRPAGQQASQQARLSRLLEFFRRNAGYPFKLEFFRPNAPEDGIVKFFRWPFCPGLPVAVGSSNDPTQRFATDFGSAELFQLAWPPCNTSLPVTSGRKNSSKQTGPHRKNSRQKINLLGHCRIICFFDTKKLD